MFNGGPIRWARRLHQSHTACLQHAMPPKKPHFYATCAPQTGNQQESETPIHAWKQKVHPQPWVKQPVPTVNRGCAHRKNQTYRTKQADYPTRLSRSQCIHTVSAMEAKIMSAGKRFELFLRLQLQLCHGSLSEPNVCARINQLNSHHAVSTNQA